MANSFEEKRNREQFEAVSEAVEKAFKQETTTLKMAVLGNQMRKQLVLRSRLGKGLTKSFGGRLVKFPSLSKLYEMERANLIRFFTKGGKVIPIKKGDKAKTKIRVSKKGKVSQFFSKGQRAPYLSKLTTPNRSNITATGQLLDSIESKGRTAKVIISVDENRKGDIFDKTADSPKTSQIIDYLKDMGRIFYGFAITEEKRYERILGAHILKATDKLLKKK